MFMVWVFLLQYIYWGLQLPFIWHGCLSSVWKNNQIQYIELNFITKNDSGSQYYRNLEVGIFKKKLHTQTVRFKLGLQ